MLTLRSVVLTALAGFAGACSSSSQPPPPTTPVAVTIPVTPPQTQGVQVPQGSGPVTGTVTFPPVTTTPADMTGNLTVSFLSGSDVAFERTALQQPAQASASTRASKASLAGGPYIFEMTVTASFPFTLASVPSFSLNLGTLGTSSTAYVLVVQIGANSPYQFPMTAQENVLTFPGANQSLAVASGTVLTFGIALSSDVPAAPTIASFSASPTSLPVGGGSVALTWSVSGATALSVDNAVGSVTPLTSGTISANVTATTPFTLTATNANGMSLATAPVCVASGPVTAAITSPTSYTQCTDPFLTSIVLTNASCEVVTINIIGFVSTAGTCGFNGPEDYTSANADLPFSVDAGVTEKVFDLQNGEIGCCATAPCSIDCSDTLEWTLMTNIGPISASAVPFTVVVSNCSNLPTCG
jgi:hypothetical protein